MRTVFLVKHSYEVGEDGEYDETKLIGIYSSREKAEEVVERYKKLPGFRDYLDDFYISEYEIDKDKSWTEGFISWEEAMEGWEEETEDEEEQVPDDMEEDQIQFVLKRSLEEGVIISVYSNPSEPDKCSAGFIDTLSTGQFVMKHVTPEGIQDGYVVRKMNDIFRVDVDGRYERRLGLLYTLQNQQHDSFIEKSVTQTSNLFVESLLTAQQKNLVVNFCIGEDEDEITGFVKEVHAEQVTISQVSFYGEEDGESALLIDSITKLNCDSTDEKILKLLFHHRQQE